MKEIPASTSEIPPELTPDQKAAHVFLTELRTRIATQPLPYQYGIEASALKSLWELFTYARQVMKDHPGCEHFARVVTRMLNVHLRPLTAKWHRPLDDGRLNSRDGADEFRGDLLVARRKLLRFAKIFHKMAYDASYRDRETPPVLEPADLKQIEFGDVKFGIPEPLIQKPSAAEAHDSIGAEAELAKALIGMNQAEADAVKVRRAYYKFTETPDYREDYNAAGLALSGGGIRSATFGLGVVQVLAEKGLLPDVDFLSTVSGGGYTGSFLTGWINSAAAVGEVGCPRGPDSAPIRYLRRHAKYLAARNPKDSWSMVISTLGGMLLNWTAPFCVIAFLAIAAIALSKHQTCWSMLFYFFSVLSVLALPVYGYYMRKDMDSARLSGEVLGWLTFSAVLTGGFWALLDGGAYLIKAVISFLSGHWTLSAAVGGGFAIAPSLIRFLPVLQSPKQRVIILKLLVWGAGLLAPLAALALFYTLWLIGDPAFARHFGLKPLLGEHGYPILWSLALLSGFIAVCIIDINLTGPHRLYRDALAKTFVKNSGSPEDARPLRLRAMSPSGAAPYHLLNATVNLPSSRGDGLRDRQCDFFLFSKHWMGAASVGYYPTGQWQANGQDVDLATAMAVSGAALSPRMGLGGMPTLTALLALLNLRLDFWIRKPDGKQRRSCFAHPGFLCLLREMTGLGMSENQAWLNLSDGGHIENMGVYELLRRRCKFVICVDGESDPDFTFSGLMTLVRHARIDFGVSIEPKLDDIRQEPKTGLSKSHAHFCRIHYPALRDKGVEIAPAGVGLLLYLKLSVTGNEPELIKRYRINHPEFPHQTTLDQFFDEEQFEAYRQLGVHVAEGLFSPALLGRQAKPTRIREWFERLAANLLFREGTG